MAANNKFKIILANMAQDDVLNFIWVYDQYICDTNYYREESEDWNESPLNIEEFYNEFYKKVFKKQ